MICPEQICSIRRLHLQLDVQYKLPQEAFERFIVENLLETEQPPRWDLNNLVRLHVLCSMSGLAIHSSRLGKARRDSINYGQIYTP
jgi:hypothetical protein